MTVGAHVAGPRDSDEIFSIGSAAITIRPILSNEDADACVALQREIWGFDVGGLVPANLIHVVGYVGGLAAGAFDANGTLVGFTFGVTGIRDGVLVHWSHMLGVRKTVRDAGVGRLLKTYQKAVLKKLGIVRIYWTFDPLQAKNAHFNFNRLGVEAEQYVPDMYGNMGSPLHFGLPTDRLIVYVRTADETPKSLSLDTGRKLPILSAFPQKGDVTPDLNGSGPPRLLIEIPADVNELTARSADEAHTWRFKVREAFQWSLARGYSVHGVHRDRSASRTFYVMATKPAS